MDLCGCYNIKEVIFKEMPIVGRLASDRIRLFATQRLDFMMNLDFYCLIYFMMSFDVMMSLDGGYHAVLNK